MTTKELDQLQAAAELAEKWCHTNSTVTYGFKSDVVLCLIAAARRLLVLERAATKMLNTWGSQDEDAIITARDEVRAALATKEAK